MDFGSTDVIVTLAPGLTVATGAIVLDAVTGATDVAANSSSAEAAAHAANPPIRTDEMANFIKRVIIAPPL